MSCCGSRRRAASTRASSSRNAPSGRSSNRGSSSGDGERGGVQLRPLVYRGPSALSVLGPVSGRVYRFARPGASLSVDPRDWLALSKMPQLQPSS
ncbi:MAG: hypothetical protein AAGD01_05230 [Acidobacteriota bacterium]